jgi:hypothetical protein
LKHNVTFTFYFSSIGLEEAYNGTTISVEKCHFVYDGQEVPNCILINYSVPNLNWDPSLSQEDVTRLVVSESDLFVKTLSLLLINPCKLLLYKICVDDVEFKPKFPIQSLGNILNLLVERNKLNTSRSVTTLVHKNGWAILEKLIVEFRVRSVTNKNKIRIALRWCAKASSEYSSIDRLVSYWISFNSLFEGLDDKEQKSIEKYIENNVDSRISQRFYTAYQKQLSVLASLRIELRNKRKVSEDLSVLLSANTKDHISIMKITLLIIYGIRNNLFHGSYDPDSSQTNKIVVIAKRLLSEFMKEIVAKEMLGYPLTSSVFRLQTKVGIG